MNGFSFWSRITSQSNFFLSAEGSHGNIAGVHCNVGIVMTSDPERVNVGDDVTVQCDVTNDEFETSSEVLLLNWYKVNLFGDKIGLKLTFHRIYMREVRSRLHFAFSEIATTKEMNPALSRETDRYSASYDVVNGRPDYSHVKYSLKIGTNRWLRYFKRHNDSVICC